MSKVLIFTVPAHGHLHPTLSIARELIARGEEVIYYTDASFASQVQATGATIHVFKSIMPSHMASIARQEKVNSQPENRPTGMPAFMINEASQVLPQVLESIRSENADYVLYDATCLWGKMAAHLLHLPAIVYQTTYATNANFSDEQLLYCRSRLTSDPEQLQSLHAKLADLGKSYDFSFSDQNPLRLIDSSEALNIAFMPRAFQPLSELFDERFLFVGPSLTPHPDTHFVQNFPSTLVEKPLLFISLGTLFNNRAGFFRQCFQAFGRQPLRVVLAHGSYVAREDLGEIPDNFLVAPYVPQLEILSQAAAFITHGGMNSTMEAPYYGVPMVVIPQMGEQAITARRVNEMQLGRYLPLDQVTITTLQSSVQEVLQNSAIKEQIASMHLATQQAGGYQRATDAILSMPHNQH